MTIAIKERKRQDKQQSQIKQQALLPTKHQCLSIFFEKKLNEKFEITSDISKINQIKQERYVTCL